METTKTQFDIETPVMKKDGYPSTWTKFGVIIEIKEGRARVMWQAAEVMDKPEYGCREKLRTWCKLSTLTVWPESLRIRLRKENVTLTASGMEYTSPKGV